MVARTLVLTALAALLMAAGFALLVHDDRVPGSPQLPQAWAAVPMSSAASAANAAPVRPPAADREVDAAEASASAASRP